MFGIVYLVENSVNGKKYIGITTYSLEERKSQHITASRMGVRRTLYNAIRKYGEDKFVWSILDYASNGDELKEKEIHWIDKLRTYIGFKDSNGYNMTLGGDGYRASHSQETKDKISETKQKSPTVYTDEARKKIGDSCRGSKNYQATPVIQLTLNGEFIAEYETVILGAEAVGGHNSNIVKCCKGQRKSAYGYKWKYKE